MNATVTIDLAEFDDIRAWADKYKEVNQGLEGFVAYLKEQEAIAEAATDKKKKKALLPYRVLIDSIKAYNATETENPFTI